MTYQVLVGWMDDRFSPAAYLRQPIKSKYRKPGTGCVTQISDHLWEGRYSPKVNGKRIARNIYATTEAECEEKLARLIRKMKTEIATGLFAGIPQS